jgi:tetratricopeptide (TPR) repeat protein
MGSIKLDIILTKAVRLARKRKYDAAIQTLEVEATRYYGSYTYYYLLGLAYLQSNIFGRALTYFRLAAEQRKMKDPYSLLGLAALYLNHGDTDRAVDLYLEVQTLDSRNKIARKALAIIKKRPSPEEISAWLDSGGLPALFPPFPRAAFARSSLALGVLAGAAGVALALGISFQAGFLFWPTDTALRELPPGFELTLEERGAPLQVADGYRFTLTSSQVLENYEEARRLFLLYRDDAARINLNRILQSNASEPIKNRARLLISYMEAPGFDTLRDRFSFSQVIQEPFLHQDIHVIWRGMASNLNVQPNATSFDLLVGYYDARRIVEGIVRVDYGFAIPINAEFPVEILGRVIPTGERAIRIQGISINQAGLLGR